MNIDYEEFLRWFDENLFKIVYEEFSFSNLIEPWLLQSSPLSFRLDQHNFLEHLQPDM